MATILVFGSNLAGRHGKGSAKLAHDSYGAQWGVGHGPTGYAYAIPTKDAQLNVLPLWEITMHVNQFIEYATANPKLTFSCVAIGTGLAGYSHHDMAPLFANCPSNVLLPLEWERLLGRPLTR